MGVLTVTLNKIENLRDSDAKGQSDPYVVFTLEKDKMLFDREFSKNESSKKQNECNPVYNESFTFHGVDSLNQMRLVIKVMDSDAGIDDCVGQTEVDLEHAGLTGSPKEVNAVLDKKRFKILKKEEATIFMQLSFKSD